MNKEVLPTIEKVQTKLDILKNEHQEVMESDSNIISILTPVAIIFLLIFMGIAIYYSYISAENLKVAIVDPLEQIIQLTNSVKKGEYDARINKLSNDEIGDLSDSFNEMVGSFENITEVAESVSIGDFSSKIDSKYEKGKLGSTINNMSDNLTKVVEQAQMIAKGDYSKQLDLKSDKDELGKALNRMTSNLKINTEELAASEKLNAAVIETVQDSIITMGVDRIITSFNHAAVKTFGYKASEIIGQNIKMLMPEKIAVHHDGYIKNHLETGKTSIIGKGRLEIGLKKDGTEFPIHLHVGKSEVEGKIVFTGVIRDLTEEEKARKEIERRTKEIEEQHWLKSNLADVFEATKGISDLSKSLNNMLSKIQNN